MRTYLHGDGNHFDRMRARPARWHNVRSQGKCSRCQSNKPLFGGTRVNNRFVCAECRAKGQLHA